MHNVSEIFNVITEKVTLPIYFLLIAYIVVEGVQIRRCAGSTKIMNSKSEWHQPALWRVRSEIARY